MGLEKGYIHGLLNNRKRVLPLFTFVYNEQVHVTGCSIVSLGIGAKQHGEQKREFLCKVPKLLLESLNQLLLIKPRPGDSNRS